METINKKTAENGKTLYIATIVEVDESGDTFGSILHAETAEDLKDQVINYLCTEETERDLNINYDEGDILLACKHGNETSGPDSITVEDSRDEYLLLTKVIQLNVKAKMTREEFDKKYKDVDTEAMSEEEFKQFKEDCFEVYEETGFLDKFDSPYDDHGEHNGMAFKVIRRATTDECDLEAMPIWFIEFENGDTAYCYPEEICKIEKKS